MNVPTGNALLDALPPKDLQRLQPHLRQVCLSAKKVLSKDGERVQHVYFPASGLVSCRASSATGETVEIYAIGHEGVVEPAAILTGVAAVTAEVQIAAEAWEIRIDDLCSALRDSTALSQSLLKYAYSLAVRMVQATKCALFHTVKQRLVLWLLLAHHSQGKLIPCTHESISEALGTRRASITVILDSLAAKGIVELERGRVTIKNLEALKDASCECFRVIQAAVEPELECELLA